MDYFIMTQDRLLDEHMIMFDGLRSAFRTLEVSKDRAQEIKDFTVVYVEGKDRIIPDLIDRPVVLMSDPLKKVIEMYDDDALFKCVVLAHPAEEMQQTYWLLLVDRLECLSDLTEYDPWGRPSRIIIDRKMAKGHAVFRIAGIDDQRLVINLDIAESILRRDLWGISLEPLESKEEEEI
ncbi:hypothetical protein [Paenibacillus pabuli]|uniref:hypothetical protein n=1 Tax=Paenibacillus pabuli TaxID=1472 RepID=UPI000784FBA4|nr:hypothetical protein [Paenibacillus pabuli]MEC0127799.1 hypothetical protein [Paenibacillus pabuli]